MSAPFSSADRSTWGELLTVKELSEILRLGVKGIERQCWLRTFVPAPAFRRPLRWKKADVVRFLDGARKSSAA